MPITWNEQNDAKLLVGILATANLKVDYKAVAKFMGPECTASAIQHRIQRLKAKVDNKVDNSETDKEISAASPSPEKPKRSRGRPKKNPTDDGSPSRKKAKTEDKNGADKTSMSFGAE